MKKAFLTALLSLNCIFQYVEASQTGFAITTFANDMCKDLSEKMGDESYCISPVSIIAALGMCLHIIQPEMKNVFLEKMGLAGISEAEAHDAISAALKGMALPTDFLYGRINIAQCLASKENVYVADSLKTVATEVYDAELIVDNNLMDAVNKWVDEKTEHKISTLLADNQIDLVLLNAVYLNLQWQEPFTPPQEGWDIKDFTCLDGSVAKVPMMKQKGDFKIYHGDGFSLLEKPYRSPEGRSLFQLIFLPNDVSFLPSLGKTLTASSIESYRSQASLYRDVTLTMPKTKNESCFELKSLLLEMGFPLDCIDQNIIPGGSIDQITHKTYISTDEKGSEAAAVTGISLTRCARWPQSFEMNRAYIYFIMDGETALFCGRVSVF
jgi:serpin B